MPSQELKFATFFDRLIARLIDVTIVFSISWMIYSSKSNTSNEFYQNPTSSYGSFFFFLFYYPILEATGGTIGKRLLSIRSVSSKTLKTISIGQAYKRSLFLSWPIWVMAGVLILGVNGGYTPVNTTIFLSALFVIFGIVGPLAVLWSAKKQGWHDSWANTYVISV